MTCLARFFALLDPEQFSDSELFVISWWCLVLALLALAVLMRPDLTLPTVLP